MLNWLSANLIEVSLQNRSHFNGFDTFSTMQIHLGNLCHQPHKVDIDKGVPWILPKMFAISASRFVGSQSLLRMRWKPSASRRGTLRTKLDF